MRVAQRLGLLVGERLLGGLGVQPEALGEPAQLVRRPRLLVARPAGRGPRPP